MSAFEATEVSLAHVQAQAESEGMLTPLGVSPLMEKDNW